MPRPEVRMRFSGANGSGSVSKSNPSPSSAMRTVNRSAIVRHRKTGPFYARCSDCRGPRRSPWTRARPSRSSSDRLRRSPPAGPHRPQVLRRCRRFPVSNPETVPRFPERDACFPAYAERPGIVGKANRQNKLPTLTKSRRGLSKNVRVKERTGESSGRSRQSCRCRRRSGNPRQGDAPALPCAAVRRFSAASSSLLRISVVTDLCCYRDLVATDLWRRRAVVARDRAD